MSNVTFGDCHCPKLKRLQHATAAAQGLWAECFMVPWLKKSTGRSVAAASLSASHWKYAGIFCFALLLKKVLVYNFCNTL